MVCIIMNFQGWRSTQIHKLPTFLHLLLEALYLTVESSLEMYRLEANLNICNTPTTILWVNKVTCSRCHYDNRL
jgi:hypothetical protein